MSLHPVNLTMKCETHEGFQCQLKNSSSDSHKGSSELGSGHTETKSGRTDATQVSSGIVCIGFSKDSFPISVPQSNNEANIHGLNKSTRMLSEDYVNICPQRSPFETRDKLRINSFEDAMY